MDATVLTKIKSGAAELADACFAFFAGFLVDLVELDFFFCFPFPLYLKEDAG